MIAHGQGGSSKAALRRHFRGLRNALSAQAREDAAQALIPLLLHAIPPNVKCIAGYVPIPMHGELDVLPALTALHARGHTIALPEVTGDVLTFRQWQPGDTLHPGPHGTQHASGKPVTPDIIIVPGLAFDAHHHRLGYGGGYYDRTLPLLNAQTIGVGFICQQADVLPVEAWDIMLHQILLT